jgi:hypothetical protein
MPRKVHISAMFSAQASVPPAYRVLDLFGPKSWLSTYTTL